MTDPAPSGRKQRGLRPLVELLPFALRYKGRIALAFLALCLAAGATLLVPIALRRMIDFGFTAENHGLVDSYFAMLLAIAAVLAIASALRYFLVMTIGERIVADVRAAVFERLATLSAGFYDTARTGELVSRLTADTTQIKATFGATASIALRNAFLVVGAGAMMVITSPKLSLFVLAAIPLIVMPLIAGGRSVRRKSREAQDTLADATAYASEMVGAMRTVQSFTAERFAVSRFGSAVETAYRAAAASLAARALLTAVAIFLVFASVIAILWYAARDVIQGDMTPGMLGQFILYAAFAAGAFSALSEVWTEFNAAAGASERLGELLREPPAIAAPLHPRPLPSPSRGAIEFRDVVFAYPTAPDRTVLAGLSFRVEPGETVAIVGPSGSGKSTVLALLQRAYDVGEGAVLIDGVDVRDVDPFDLRRRLAVVSQEPVIFAASVADNISLGRPDATGHDIAEAARLADADRFIADLPQGFATIIGERGVTLSGGQRQRIAIARAILRDAPVLLLDEATSALDSESEHAVQAALDRLIGDRTTLVVAHRLSTVLAADRILVLEDGRLVDSGPHRELVARGGLYARLARLQFGEAA